MFGPQGVCLNSKVSDHCFTVKVLMNKQKIRRLNKQTFFWKLKKKINTVYKKKYVFMWFLKKRQTWKTNVKAHILTHTCLHVLVHPHTADSSFPAAICALCIPQITPKVMYNMISPHAVWIYTSGVDTGWEYGSSKTVWRHTQRRQLCLCRSRSVCAFKRLCLYINRGCELVCVKLFGPMLTVKN